MPLALCVADNGAVTGVFTRRPNDEAIERALVTPAMAEATKALQDKKIVVVHVKQTRQIAAAGGCGGVRGRSRFSGADDGHRRRARRSGGEPLS